MSHFNKNLIKKEIKRESVKNIQKCDIKNCLYEAKVIYFFSSAESIKLCSHCERVLKNLSHRDKKKLKQEELIKWQNQK